MGIRGLASFVQSHGDSFLRRRKLYDCTVVFDGLCVANDLHDLCTDVSSCLGGDLDVYGKYLSGFFDRLTKCNIRPVVLLDGSSKSGKLDTMLTRVQQKIGRAISCNPWNQIKVAPLLMVEVFICVMREKGVAFVQCEKEADHVLVQLARKLRAPVISNDSDFYVSDVRFIPFNSLEPLVYVQDGLHFLMCQEFDRSGFLKFHGVDQEKLPLLAVLVGNDYVSDGALVSIIQRTAPQQDCAFSKKMNPQKRISASLQWLSCQKKNLEDTIQTVLGFINADDRERIRRAINSGMEEYLACSTQQDQGSSVEEIIEIFRKKPWDVRDCEGRRIHQSFVDAFRDSKLPRYCLDLVTQRYTILKPSVECEEYNTSFTSALNLLLAISWILLGDSKGDNNITFYMRKQRQLVPTTFDVKESFMQAPNVPELSKIQDMSMEDRKCLMLRIMHLESDAHVIDTLPEDLRLLALAILLCKRNSEVNIANIHSLSIVLCYLFLSVFERKKLVLERNHGKLGELRQESPYIENFTQESSELDFEAISREECIEAKYHLVEQLPLDIRRGFEEHVQVFANLQAVIHVLRSLNAIFGDVYRNPMIHYLLSGTLFYKFSCMLASRADPEQSVMDMLSNTPRVRALFKSAFKVIGKYDRNFQPSTSTLNKRTWEGDVNPEVKKFRGHRWRRNQRNWRRHKKC